MLGQTDRGAIHLIEAAMAAAIVMAALYYVNSAMPSPHNDRTGDLEALSSDLLNILEFRANSLEHPSLGFALSSGSQWKESSDELYNDIVPMLPPGTYCYLETPYGNVGQCPAARSVVYVRPFIASGEAGAMLDCKLILWRA